jgi:D-alanyl-lipoteichoic acid acyltransferase DltB (MBOAT superfamily)
MPEKVLKAVAMPTTMFWVPQVPAIANMVLNAMLIIFGWAIFRMSPLPFIFTLLMGHMFLASQAFKEPHMTTVIRAWLESRNKTRNLVKSSTNKYVP